MLFTLGIISVLSLGLAPSTRQKGDYVEVEEMREECSKTYLVSEGNYISYYYGSPINYLKDGHYVPIDTSFEKNDDVFITKSSLNIVKVKNDSITVNDNISFSNYLINKQYECKENVISQNDLSISSFSSSLLFTKKNIKSNGKIYTSSLSFSTYENANIYKKDNGLLILINDCSYILTLPALFNYENNLVIMPYDYSVNIENGDFTLDFMFNLNDYVDLSFEQEQQLMYTNYSGTSYIQTKYYQEGYSTTYNSSLLVGNSSVLDPLGNPTIYKIAIGITLPSLPTGTHSISNAGLVLKRKSGNLSSLLIYKTSGISFANINGTASFSSSYFNSATISGTLFTTDLLSEVIDDYNNSVSSFNFIVSGGQSNKTCYIYPQSSSSYQPYYYIGFSSSRGNTVSSRDGSSTQINCLGYALNISSGSTITSGLTGATVINAPTKMIAALLNDSNHNLIDVYQISSYQDLISSNYRIIAFRLKMTANSAGVLIYSGDYHFRWQTSDGYWGEKYGYSNQFGYLNVLNITSDSQWPSAYNSPTYYLAIQQ